MPTKTAEINNITLLINRDRISIFMSEKVGADHRIPSALMDLACFETQCLNDGRPTFAEMADRLGCKIGDFVDLDNRLSSPVTRDRIAQTNLIFFYCLHFCIWLEIHKKIFRV